MAGVKKKWRGAAVRVFEFLLKRERLLFSFPANLTVGILWGKKERCSTQRGLHVGSGFREFRQTLRGRGFILLEFYILFKCIYDV